MSSINNTYLVDLDSDLSEGMYDYYKQEEVKKEQFKKQMANLFIGYLNKGEDIAKRKKA